MVPNSKQVCLYSARYVLQDAERLLIDGAVRVVDGKIDAVAPRNHFPALPGYTEIELGEVVLAPGLVNPHTHLEYSACRGKLPAGPFMQWLPGMIKAKADLDLPDIESGIQSGISELLRTGTTTVGDISGFDCSIPFLEKSGMRYVCYYEIIDVSHAPFNGYLDNLDARLAQYSPGVLGRVGLSPHAPYTVSEPLMRVLRESYHHRQNLPFAMHVAETRSEIACLAWQSGPLAKMLRAAEFYGPKGETPICNSGLDFLQAGRMSGGKIDQVVHGNCLAESERLALAQAGESVLVVCPSTRRWHKQNRPVFTQAQRAGLPIALATDSLASNDRLDMVHEMRESLRDAPCGWTATDAFRAATQGGARAMNLSEEAGRLEPGLVADFITLDCSEARPDADYHTFQSARMLLDYWLQDKKSLPVCGSWVQGVLLYNKS